MALTVNSKPSGFRPIGGGELIYQFTEASVSGKPNYRVEISCNGITGTFQYRPDASLVIRADIAPILRSALDISFLPADRYVSTYVTYQAVWDGGSDSAVNLTGDVIFAYLGVEHDLNKRTVYHIGASNNGPLLSHGDTIYLWPNRTNYIEFLSGSDMFNPTYCRYVPNDDLGAAVFLEFSWAPGSFGFDGTAYGLHSFAIDPTADGRIEIVKTSGGDVVYRTFRVKVLPECSNPVYLKWINDYGGISTWLFSYNQIYNFTPQLLWRDKVLTVETNVISFEQWQMLQELNKDGVEYGDNQKVGQLVVDFTDEAYPVNVFPLPESSETWTKKAKHNFSLAFRYAQIPNILL